MHKMVEKVTTHPMTAEVRNVRGPGGPQGQCGEGSLTRRRGERVGERVRRGHRRGDEKRGGNGRKEERTPALTIDPLMSGISERGRNLSGTEYGDEREG